MTGDEIQLRDGLEASYILGDAITRGQFSTVYKCLYKGKIERACRTYEKDKVNLNKVTKYLQEILQIVHPNLIRIYDGFQTPDEIHFITERVYGEELFERIVDLGHYSEREAASLIKDILSALVCLHDKGIVHGDIRPESLIYSNEGHDGTLKLRDVSFSKWTPNTHATIFIAPEKGETPSIAGDMWSLGIVLYIMLCGIEPGAGEVFTELVPGLSLPWWEDISKQAKEVIQRMLDLNPYSRLKADEAYQIPWVQGSVTQEHHLEAAVERLREFNAKAKFRVASKAVLATRKLSLPFLRRMELR
ncbi:calcium/calmodulin-dependent protein kinase type IV isoform X2 [Halyomorpha halys]|uniref:calcium/calmodulin-dependent protein kinase type IV isoform X2 n=1 Tax=Halyomorpha halys TaxID=286706 RepID=UPI0006D5145A|nr:calcium/calmodulin-dependent protein kinase type IV-like isoform X1 [Halyomorpha halys]XP_014279205.1 calcium/calmodulin-dependent protein kinase type IV-like isoform X1 [Halyomorpha halys]